MFQALKKEFEEITPLGPLDHWYKYFAKLKGKLKTFGSDKVFKYQYDINLAKKHAAILDKRIKRERPDVLLGSLVSPEVAYLKSEIPLYLTTDATFPRLNLLHKSHRNLYQESFENALKLEEHAFSKAKKLILPLEWLKDSAINDYRIDKNKIEVIPYGANIETVSDSEEVQQMIYGRQKSRELKLFFVGINWEEKGGPKAVQVLQALKRMGISSSLTIVGCSPVIEDEDVKVLGFLDKGSNSDLEKLITLYKEASFFLLPTKAECVGMSFIEAASYGLPSIGSDVGGVPEAVIDGETGYVFGSESIPNKIAKAIVKTWEDKELYKAMSQKARAYFKENMNWKSWAEKLREVVEGME